MIDIVAGKAARASREGPCKTTTLARRADILEGPIAIAAQATFRSDFIRLF
jgi:hypothetical protein